MAQRLVGSNRLHGWIASQVASAIWAALLTSMIAFAILPIDGGHLPLAFAPPLLTLVFAAIFRRRRLLVLTFGMVASAVATASMPFAYSSSFIYFVRCPSLNSCWRTARQADEVGDAVIFPVADPLKWALWRYLARGDQRFRTIQEGIADNGEIVLHAPFERDYSMMAREDPEPYVHLILRPRMLTLSLDYRAGVMTNVRLRDDRYALLKWDSPWDINSPGFFSAMGRPDELDRVSAEVVRADLMAHALLQGRWRAVAEATAHQRPNSSARERLRDLVITTALIARVDHGNVLSAERWSALRTLLPTLAELKNQAGPNDTLVRASIAMALNIYLAHDGPPEPHGRASNLSFSEIGLFDQEVDALFGFVENPVEQRSEWEAALQERRDDPQIDPSSMELSGGAAFAPFTPTNFTPAFLRSVLDRAKSAEDYDRIIYAASQQIRERLFTLFPNAGGHTTLAQLAPSGFGEFMRATSNIALAASEKASPGAREILTTELRANLVVAGRLASVADPDFVPDIATDDPNGEEEIRRLAALLAEIGDSTTPVGWSGEASCAWYDYSFQRRFMAQFVQTAGWIKRENLQALSAAVPKLWADYSQDGRCHNFIPGVMLLHAALKITGDSRSSRTRNQIDNIFGADAGWLREVYADAAHNDYFEGRPEMQRIRLLPNAVRAVH